MEITTIKARAFINYPDSLLIRKDIEENPKTFVTQLLKARHQFGVDNLISTGYHKEQGYLYDLRPFLRHFLVQSYGAWHEMYALNKQNARKLTHSRVTRIVEIKD